MDTDKEGCEENLTTDEHGWTRIKKVVKKINH
jgi:RNA:NAD 2'-phosphotransferase (TPT1/KptA family)